MSGMDARPCGCGEWDTVDGMGVTEAMWVRWIVLCMWGGCGTCGCGGYDPVGVVGVTLQVRWH